MKFQIKRFADPSAPDFEALLPEWEALDAQMSPRSPHTSPIWCRLWWQYLRRRTISSRDEFFLHTVRDELGHLIAVAPLMITHKPALGPLRLRLLQFIGADPSMTEVRGLVCRIENQDEVIRSLIEYFTAYSNEWDLFLWRGLRVPELSINYLNPLGGLDINDTLPCYVLDLPESWDKLIASVSSNTRKSIRKSYEYLERDGYKFFFQPRHRPEDLPAALNQFFTLHAARSLAKDMKEHRDQFTSQRQHIIMLEDFARKMAERGQLLMLELEINEKVVATRIAFQLDKDLYLYFSGFNPDWRKYGVMTTLTSETIKWAIENGFKRVNLSTGNDLGKTRWRPLEILYYNKVQASPTWRGRLAFHIYNSVVNLRNSWSFYLLSFPNQRWMVRLAWFKLATRRALLGR